MRRVGASADRRGSASACPGCGQDGADCGAHWRCFSCLEAVVSLDEGEVPVTPSVPSACHRGWAQGRLAWQVAHRSGRRRGRDLAASRGSR